MENDLKSTKPTMVEPKKRIIRVKKRPLIKPELNIKSESSIEPEPKPKSEPKSEPEPEITVKPKPKTRIIRVRKQPKPISSFLKKEIPQTRNVKRNVVTETTTTTTTTTTTRMRYVTENMSSIERDYLDAMDDKQRQVYEIAKDHLGSSFHLRKSIGFQQYLEKKNSLKCK